MRVIATFFFTFLLLSSLCAHNEFSTEWSAEAIAPCAIHNGSVNVITGQYIEQVEQIRLRSPFALNLTRSYRGPDKPDDSMRVICWRMGDSSLQCVEEGEKRRKAKNLRAGHYPALAIEDLTGSRVAYAKQAERNEWRPMLGPLWSNIAWGEISGRTNPRNRRVNATLSRGFALKKGNGDWFHFASRFANEPWFYRDEGMRDFPLRKIERASGHRVEVGYVEDSKALGYGRPLEFSLLSKSGQQLGWMRFEYTHRIDNARLAAGFCPENHAVTLSDGQRVDLIIEPFRHRLMEVNRPGWPVVKYEYNTTTHSKYTKVKGLYRLTKRTEYENYLETCYYDVGKNWVGNQCVEVESAGTGKGRVEHPVINCVKEQFAPVGPNEKRESVARYYYRLSPLKNSDPMNSPGSTRAEDAQGNLTVYNWGSGQRITSVERYQGQDELLMCERYSYGGDGSELAGKVYFDQSGKPVAAMTLEYDAYGNVICEKLWGNLTGHCPAGIELDRQGLPIENGVDCFVRRFEYSQCGAYGLGPNNLKVAEKSGDRTIRWTYWGDTDRIATLSVYDKEALTRRLSFEYDENGALIEQRRESGSRPARTIRIRPVRSGPAIGFPERAEEYVGGEFIGAVERRYGIYNQVVEEAHYDGDNCLRFTLYTDYDLAGRPIRVTDPEGAVTEFAYDAGGRLACERRPQLGREQSYLYDGANRCTKTTLEAPGEISVTFRFGYDTLSCLIEEENELGQITAYKHDALGRVVSSQELDGGQIEKRGPLLHPAVVALRGQLGMRDEPEFENTGPTSHFSHDLFGNCTRIKSPTGEVEERCYTVRGQVAESRYPDGTSEKFLYDLEGRLVQKVDRNGLITRMTYDGMRHLLSIAEQGRDGTPGRELHLRYDGDLLISSREGEVETFYTHDAASRLVAERCGERLTEAEYDSLGREVRRIVWFGTGACDHTDTVWEYDLCGRVVEERVEDGEGRVWSRIGWAYDAEGNVVATTTYGADGVEQVERVAYEQRNRPIRRVDPLGNVTTYLYEEATDRLGNRVAQVQTVDPVGNVQEERYDVLGRLASVESLDPFGVRTAYTEYLYNADGYKIEERHLVLLNGQELGCQSIRWEYGPGGRIEAIHEELGKTTRFRYNAFGECVAKILPSGQELLFSYDGLGRLQEERGPDFCYRYQYDWNNNLIAVEESGERSASRTYDAYGQLLSETLSNGLTLSFAYDRSGRRVRTHLPDGSQIHYEHDPIGVSCVTRLSAAGESTSRRVVERDPCGRPLLERSEPGGAKWRYRWDARGQLVESESPDGATSSRYDELGRLCLCEGWDGGGPYKQSYRYDPLSQLSEEREEWTNTFECDSLGNHRRVSGTGHQINGLNQVADLAEYDRDGRVVATGGMSCRYDGRGRLVSLERGGDRWVYTYDCFDRRISERRITGGEEKLGHFLYDGEQEIGRFDCPTLSELRVVMEREVGVRPLTVMIEVEGVPLFVTTNQRGDLLALTTKEGENVATLRYSAYGHRRLFGEDLSPWGFAGKRLDPSGWSYFGRRYYSPFLHRWLTPDPAGFIDGPNLYRYCWNNPFAFIDWLGEKGESGGNRGSDLFDFSTGRGFGGLKDSSASNNNAARALLGAIAGAIIWVARMFHDLWTSSAYIGMDGLELDERMWIMDGIDRSQARQIRFIDVNMMTLFEVDEDDLVYQRFRDGTALTLEIGSLAVGGYGLVKGGIGLVRVMRAPVQVARMSGQVMRASGLVSREPLQIMKSTQSTPNPLHGTRYSQKVLTQMQSAYKNGVGDFHGFPQIVDNYANLGLNEFILGGDGLQRRRIRVQGAYRGREGFFEWIIEPDQSIKHRVFVHDKDR